MALGYIALLSVLYNPVMKRHTEHKSKTYVFNLTVQECTKFWKYFTGEPKSLNA